MTAESERPRALVAVSPGAEPLLRSLFGRAALADWDLTVSDSSEQARFVLQHTPHDVLLIDESMIEHRGVDALSWLARQHEAPAVLLAGPSSRLWAYAFEHGVNACVPRQLGLEYPNLVAAALRRASQSAHLLRGYRQAREGWHQCRRQVDRLVDLLWRAVPLEQAGVWLTQRHILERLRDEVARSGRHGVPLTVALGEVQAEGETGPAQLADWTSQRIAGVKRRCDVAGQYGPHGFLLLMVHTQGEGGVACCRRLQKTLQQEQPLGSGPPPVRASFGVASYSPRYDTLQALLGGAEQRLEAARQGTTGGVVAD